MNEIFAIFEAWIDPLENDLDAAFGWEIYAFTTDLKEAKSFCAKGGRIERKECWALPGKGVYRYKFKKIKNLKSKLKKPPRDNRQ